MKDSIWHCALEGVLKTLLYTKHNQWLEQRIELTQIVTSAAFTMLLRLNAKGTASMIDLQPYNRRSSNPQ